MNLILLGPPASGKGTQAALLASRLGLHHLSTGDLLRDEARSGSQLGATARQYMDSGRLVPDEIVLGVVRQRLSTLSPNAGFVLDGFPRTLPQALALEQALQQGYLPLPKAVLIQVSEDAILSRLRGRLTCPQCHTVFHLQAKPPRRDRVCDNCGSQLARRADEDPPVVRERLRAYASEMEAVSRYYRNKKALVEVSGDGSIEEVSQHILSALGPHPHDTGQE